MPVLPNTIAIEPVLIEVGSASVQDVRDGNSQHGGARHESWQDDVDTLHGHENVDYEIED